MSLAQLLDNSFSRLSVMIIGDIMIDAYRWGSAERISPEAPVPILLVKRSNERPGGAANVAINAMALGAKVTLIGVAGNDKAGEDLVEMIRSEGLETDGIITAYDRPTTLKTRIISGSMHLLRVDNESNELLSKEDEGNLLEKVESEIDTADVLILQDYDKGVFSESGIEKIVRLAKKNNVLIAVDPKKRNFLHFNSVDLFKPNFKELIEGLNMEIERTETDLKEACKNLTKKIRASAVMLTLSEKGAYYYSHDDSGLIPAHSRNIVDVSGAGDTVITVAAMALKSGQSLEVATELANLAGGIVCEYPGVVAIDKARFLSELRELERIN